VWKREDVDLETVGSLANTMPYNGDSDYVLRPRFSDVTAMTKLSGLPTSPYFHSNPVSIPIEKEVSSGSAVHTSPSPPNSAGKVLWKNAVRNVKIRNAILATESVTGAPLTTPPALLEDNYQHSSIPVSASVGVVNGAGRAEPIRRRTTSSGFGKSPNFERKKAIGLGEPFMNGRARMGALIPRLLELEPTQDLSVHTALVRHMQFSPDGKFLATSSWDKTSVIFKVGVRQLDYTGFLLGWLTVRLTASIRSPSYISTQPRLCRSSGVVRLFAHGI